MSDAEQVIIDLAERFQHLSSAPIVEAVVEVRVPDVKELTEDTVRTELQANLSDYVFFGSAKGFKREVKLEDPAKSTLEDFGWAGTRFRSADEKHIVKVSRTGLAFSRLQPYQNWGQLTKEFLRLWGIFRIVANPEKIVRIGLRFVNRIELPPSETRFEDYIQPCPLPPRGLSLPHSHFLYQDRLVVPDYPYEINIIHTIQPSQVEGSVALRLGLVLDIDVFSQVEFPVDQNVLEQRLLEMRWLKNKVFFGSITDKALEILR